MITTRRRAQVTRGDIAVRKERLDCLLAFADQQGRLARLPEIVGRHDRLAVGQHALGHNEPVRLFSKDGSDWTRRYPWIADAALKKNRQKHFIIESEAVMLGVDGISDFNALHSRKHDVQFCAFDILVEGGDDLRKLPLKPSAAVSASPFQKECPPGVNQRAQKGNRYAISLRLICGKSSPASACR
jgi:hypothetical protein